MLEKTCWDGSREHFLLHVCERVTPLSLFYPLSLSSIRDSFQRPRRDQSIPVAIAIPRQLRTTRTLYLYLQFRQPSVKTCLTTLNIDTIYTPDLNRHYTNHKSWSEMAAFSFFSHKCLLENQTTTAQWRYTIVKVIYIYIYIVINSLHKNIYIYIRVADERRVR